MVNAAAATVPAVAGNVTPLPAVVRELAVVRITDPPAAGDTATFPKLISVTFVIAIGVTTVAVALAVAPACALAAALENSKLISIVI